MLTKGIIKSIDYTGNTGTVHIPFFDGAVGGDPFIQTAIFINPPGIYGGYKVEDTVIVGFEDQELSRIIVLGKLFLGANQETECRGTINCESLLAENKVMLPTNTELDSYNPNNRADVSGNNTSYKNIQDIISKLQVLDKQININATDYVIEKNLDSLDTTATVIGTLPIQTGTKLNNIIEINASYLYNNIWYHLINGINITINSTTGEVSAASQATLTDIKLIVKIKYNVININE